MPLDLLDLPKLVGPSASVVRSLGASLRKRSDGGKKITKAEAKEIGQTLVKLGEAFLAAAVD